MIETTTKRASQPRGVLAFRAANVTGTQQIPVEVASSWSVSAVTSSIVDRMSLPDDVSWALRDDGSSAYLDDERTIGDQIEPGTRITITPRAHLGGTPGPGA